MSDKFPPRFWINPLKRTFHLNYTVVATPKTDCCTFKGPSDLEYLSLEEHLCLMDLERSIGIGFCEDKEEIISELKRQNKVMRDVIKETIPYFDLTNCGCDSSVGFFCEECCRHEDLTKALDTCKETK